MKLLDLPDHPRTIVYQHIVDALKNDPILKAIVKDWRTYTDEDDNDTPPGEDSLPAIEIMPFGQGASSESPVHQDSPLGIAINVATEGIDVRDLLNLWGAVENAVFKGDGSRAVGQAIRVAIDGTGAQYHTMSLSSPGITASGLDKQMMIGSGTITVKMSIRK